MYDNLCPYSLCITYDTVYYFPKYMQNVQINIFHDVFDAFPSNLTYRNNENLILK